MSSPLILASGSPRRRELLGLLKLPFTVDKPDVDETIRPGEPPVEYVERLSREKAAAVAARHEAGIVVAADTIVVHRGEVLGKPEDEAHAREMLRRLRGEQHRVLTAVTVQDAATGKAITELCDSKVRLRAMGDQEIDDYIATGDPMDKAAAYAIQNVQFAPAEEVVGCPANVMGLPMCHVLRSFRRLGIPLPPSEPQACQITYGGYYCAIADQVMPGLTDRGSLPKR